MTQAPPPGDPADSSLPGPVDFTPAPDQPADPTAPADERRKPPRLVLRVVLALIVARIIMGYVGDFIFAGLIPDPKKGQEGNPLLLIAINPRKRYLLTAKDVALPLYLGVAMLSQAFTDPLYYMLGRWYGDKGIRWAEQKFGDSVTQMESMFKRASYPMVALVPNAYICLLAGASGMAVVPFLVLNLGGTLAALLLWRWAGDIFSSPLDGVFSFLARYRWQLMVISGLLIGYQLWDQKRRGRSQVGSVAGLESEIESGGAPVAEPGVEPVGREPTG